ncbi:MAG: phospho-N-acetylmuramoyl-pentapeptide-transferase [Sulfuricurvum sp. PC08-66]|nr:MAG: phospho-N-acetylmuramoyl-pentapeptide-transferase [Sulfuricurvum sp. PC08-66]
MLHFLYSYFHINVLQYITVRAGIAFILSTLFVLFALPLFVRWAKAQQLNQPIYDLAPQGHQVKARTPTMGGVIFITGTLIASLLTMDWSNFYAWVGVGVLTAFMLVGFQDDFGKISQNSNTAGLTARHKSTLQFMLSLLFMIVLYSHDAFGTQLYVPFYKEPLFSMGLFALLFWVFVMVGTSNAVNLTDGLDGLATVPSIFSLLSLGIIAYLTGNMVLSTYLLLPSIQGVGEVTILASALAGALIGFLWYNAHPAEVFMGDSGSLSIGAFIAYMAIITKSEILLILIGLIFVIETISVMLQVGSFKLRKKRIFLMAPIHHHFEMKKWAENKIIVRFWIIAMLSNLVALISLKIR